MRLGTLLLSISSILHGMDTSVHTTKYTKNIDYDRIQYNYVSLKNLLTFIQQKDNIQPSVAITWYQSKDENKLRDYLKEYYYHEMCKLYKSFCTKNNGSNSFTSLVSFITNEVKATGLAHIANKDLQQYKKDFNIYNFITLLVLFRHMHTMLPADIIKNILTFDVQEKIDSLFFKFYIDSYHFSGTLNRFLLTTTICAMTVVNKNIITDGKAVVNRIIITGCRDGKILCYNVDTKKVRTVDNQQQNSIHTIAATADYIAASYNKCPTRSIIYIWNFDGSYKIHIPVKVNARALIFNNDLLFYENKVNGINMVCAYNIKTNTTTQIEKNEKKSIESFCLYNNTLIWSINFQLFAWDFVQNKYIISSELLNHLGNKLLSNNNAIFSLCSRGHLSKHTISFDSNNAERISYMYNRYINKPHQSLYYSQEMNALAISDKVLICAGAEPIVFYNVNDKFPLRKLQWKKNNNCSSPEINALAFIDETILAAGTNDGIDVFSPSFSLKEAITNLTAAQSLALTFYI